MPEDDRSSRSVRMCYVIIVVIFLLNNDTIPLASLRYRYTISNSWSSASSSSSAINKNYCFTAVVVDQLLSATAPHPPTSSAATYLLATMRFVCRTGEAPFSVRDDGPWHDKRPQQTEAIVSFGAAAFAAMTLADSWARHSSFLWWRIHSIQAAVAEEEKAASMGRALLLEQSKINWKVVNISIRSLSMPPLKNYCSHLIDNYLSPVQWACSAAEDIPM